MADLNIFLDIVQVALQQMRDASRCCDDLDVLIRLDAILQCLMWVEPKFMPSVNFSNLLSAVSDMSILLFWNRAFLPTEEDHN